MLAVIRRKHKDDYEQRENAANTILDLLEQYRGKRF